MWDFEHPPRNTELAQRYHVHYTQPSSMRRRTPRRPRRPRTHPHRVAHAIVRHRPRLHHRLAGPRPLHPTHRQTEEPAAAKTSTDPSPQSTPSPPTPPRAAHSPTRRSSSADSSGPIPEFVPAAADPFAMLAHADAALLIGDPALLALESATASKPPPAPASGWTWPTNGTPALACPGSPPSGPSAPKPSPPHRSPPRSSPKTSSNPATTASPTSTQLVAEWTPRIAIPPATIRHYLTQQHSLHAVADLHCRHPTLPPLRR